MFLYLLIHLSFYRSVYIICIKRYPKHEQRMTEINFIVCFYFHGTETELHTLLYKLDISSRLSVQTAAS